MRDAPLACVVVLNYNGRQHLEYCLPSIAATDYRLLRIMLVDNASSDDSVAYVQQHFPAVIVLRSEVNRGWSGGNNLGIARAHELGARYVVLANNDIRVDPRWVKVAVCLAEQDARIGVIGYRILEPRAGDEDAGFTQAVAEWRELQMADDEIVDGMAMFVRMDLFEQLGPIDEGFFAYGEDNDLERRARRAGYRVVRTNVPIWHRGQGTFGRTPLWSAALQIRNNLRLALKHENAAGVIYQLLRHLAKGCLPFVSVDRHDPIARRLRPSNPAVNFLILLYAVIWNALHLPATLRRRRADEQRIQRARQQLGRS